MALAFYDRYAAIMRRRYFLASLLLLLSLPGGAWYWLLHTESGMRWVWARAASAMDGTLQGDRVTGRLASGFVLSGIEYKAGSVDVSIDEVSAAINVSLPAFNVRIDGARASGVLVDLDDESDAGSQIETNELIEQLALPVELAVADLELQSVSIQGGSASTRFDITTASLAGSWGDTIQIDRFEMRSPDLAAVGEASLDLGGRHDLAGELELTVDSQSVGLDEPLVLVALIRGPIDDLLIEATTEGPETTLRGRVNDITGAPRWNLNLSAPHIRLPDFGDLPSMPPAAVEAELHGDFESFAAAAQVVVPDAGMDFALDAEVDMETRAISGDLSWRNAHWPVGAVEAQVLSRTGHVALAGTLDEWRAQGKFDLDVPQLPAGILTLDIRGDREQASAQILEGELLGGSVGGRAEFSWAGSMRYGAELELNGIRTAPLLPHWPGELTGKLSVAGQQEPFRLTAELEDVTGELDGSPLVGEGRIAADSQTVVVQGLNLQHGETRIQADGDPYAANGLTFTLSVDDLGRYVEDAAGMVSASGEISLAKGAQFLRIDASSEMLGYRNFEISNFTVTDRGNAETVLDTDILAEAISYGGVTATDVRLQAAMGRLQQSLQLDVATGGFGTKLVLEGALDDWDQPTFWEGTLSTLDIRNEELSAALTESANLMVTTQSAVIREACLVGESGLNLCAEGAWHAEGDSRVSAWLASVPVNLVNAVVDTGLDFNQVIDGGFELQLAADGLATGRSEMTMTQGRVTSSNHPDLELETGAARLGFEIDGGSLRSGIIDLPLPELGHVSAEFEVLDMSAAAGSEFAGLIDVDVADIGPLIVFFPALDQASGVLRADLDISGTMKAPVMAGEFHLRNGVVTYLPIGLRLDQINLRSELQDNGEITLNGSFRAGDGEATVQTRTTSSRSAGLELELRGHNLTLIDVPDVRAIADTDVYVAFDGDTLSLDGSVVIPHARVRPDNISRARLHESEDVLVVAGELPEEPADDTEAINQQIVGSMDITLGRDVVVDLGVAETQVTGNAIFTWTGDVMPVVDGRYDVTGEILAFGQRLEISQGTIGFPNVPANDPALRISAEREIYGNTQVRRAGVRVVGNLSRLTVEAYTTPLTTEERAATLLVTGSDFDYDKGIGAVDFGTYIAPRIFASYGIGLFDNGNVIRLRYDLKKGIGITGTSGQKESGLDLSYQFEN